MDTAKEAIQREIMEEVDAKMFKIKKSLLDPTQGPVIFSQIGNSELRKKYANMTATDAVLEVFINAESIFSKSMTKVSSLEDSQPEQVLIKFASWFFLWFGCLKSPTAMEPA